MELLVDPSAVTTIDPQALTIIYKFLYVHYGFPSTYDVLSDLGLSREECF
uniref:LisH domain-containing protein n=1 Tax=Heterorhabditis bacteriophora TaxID=37862 RepID=A0A1I7XP91_HETBA